MSVEPNHSPSCPWGKTHFEFQNLRSISYCEGSTYYTQIQNPEQHILSKSECIAEVKIFKRGNTHISFNDPEDNFSVQPGKDKQKNFLSFPDPLPYVIHAGLII